MTPGKNGRDLAVIGWHVLAIATLLLLPRLKFSVPFWRMDPEELRPLLFAVGAYVVCAAGVPLARFVGARYGVIRVVLAFLVVFGLLFTYLWLRKVDSSRAVMGYAFAASFVLLVLSLWASRHAVLAPLGLAVAVAALVALNLKPSSELRRKGEPVASSDIVTTRFYNLRAVSYLDYTPAPAVSGGGLARLSDGALLVTGDGLIYRLAFKGDDDALEVTPAALHVPLNGEEFSQDTAGRTWHQPLAGEPVMHAKEDAGNDIISWWFRTTGVLAQENGDQLRLFAAHHYWKRDQRCWVERVSVVEGAREALLKDPAPAWRTLYESTPCLPIDGPDRRRGTAFAGHFGGGRLALLDADTLLLSVGDFGFNGIASRQIFSQDPAASYGKIIRIDLTTGAAAMHALGVRNPQGLAVSPTGEVWETEHGPQGGDELNRIRPGANYGWPMVTYGADYGTFAWPLNANQGEHEGFEAPFYAWVPSVGISDLIVVRGDLFERWKGDLMVTSLAGQTVFRMRVRNDRVVYVEPMKFGNRRIRDIAELSDGRILLWQDDDNTLVSLRPVTGSSGELLFATQCAGCHKVGDGTSHRIGPDLWGVLDRPVASAKAFLGYSAGLRALGGQWTPERLDDFLSDPQKVAPGTAMEIEGVKDADARAKIIEYLRTAKKVSLD